MRNHLLSVLITSVFFAVAPCAHGATNYWDNNGATPGFGTAGGTWGIDGNWSEDSSGASAPATTNTTAADELYFGGAAVGLAAGTISVAGTDQGFKTMTFGAASGAITLTNGTLNLAAPVAKIAAYNSSNTIATVLAGNADLHKSELLHYGEFLTPSDKILFKNATLADCTVISGMVGGSYINAGRPVPGEIFYVINNSTNLTCQMQALDKTLVKFAKIELTQIGDDIYGRAVDAGNANASLFGYDFDITPYNKSVIATATNLKAYGVAQITLSSGAFSPTVLTENQPATTLFSNATLARVLQVNGSLCGTMVNGNKPLQGQLFFFENNGTTATFQLQVIDGDYTKCVKIELTQVGQNIHAQALYAKNIDRLELGFDFDTGGSSGTYQAKNLSISYKNDSILTLAAANTYSGDTIIDNGTLEISGTGSLGEGTYSGGIKNDGELRFSDSASQTLSGNITGSGSVIVSGFTPTNDLTPTSLTLCGTNSYSGGTVINCGTLVAETNRFAISSAGPITINEGGELYLSVAGDSALVPGSAGGVGGDRAILVNSGGRLILAASFNAGYARPIILDNGTLHSTSYSAARNDNYSNDITLKNNAQITGNPPQVGYVSDATIKVRGTNTSTIASGLCLVKHKNVGYNHTLILDVADVTGDNAADLLITGMLRDYSVSYTNLPTIKIGAGTVSFSAVNSHQGPYTLTQGTILLAGDDTLNVDNEIILNGGALDMGAVSNSAGALALTANSELVLGSGKIAFKNSSDLSWSGTLTLTGTLIEGSVRFGTDSSGLTQAQLDAIYYNNGKHVRLDKDGYLTARPTGTLITIQ